MAKDLTSIWKKKGGKINLLLHLLYQTIAQVLAGIIILKTSEKCIEMRVDKQEVKIN